MVDRRLRKKERGGRVDKSLPSFGVLDGGEPDANVEALVAQRRKLPPLYIDGYTEPPGFSFGLFENGEKFILIGQKGTGKTALLRNLQNRLQVDGFGTEYIIFRETVMEEGEITSLPSHFVVSKKDLKNSSFYHHCLKRIFLTAILRNLVTLEKIDAEIGKVDRNGRLESTVSWLASFARKAVSCEAGQTVSMVVDSVFSDVAHLRTLLGLERNPSQDEITRNLKRMNDALFDMCVKSAKQSKPKFALIVDEIHFQYRDYQSVRDDAILVRDVITCIFAINERFIKEGLSIGIFAGIRSEYLSHPVIAAVEVNTKVESYGSRLGWETVPANASHPVFDLVENRIIASIQQISGSANGYEKVGRILYRGLFANVDKSEFIQSILGRPRDVVRFVRAASRLFSTHRTLTEQQYHAAFRATAIESWDEMKSALSSFLSEKGILLLEAYLQSKASLSLETGRFAKFSEFSSDLTEILVEDLGDQKEISVPHFIDIIYMLGIIFTSRQTKNMGAIYDSYHRGQRNPNKTGDVGITKIVAKAFS